MQHDNEYHDDINYGNRFPDDWYFYEDNSQPSLTDNEYNLVLYCLEQQWDEFNKEEKKDANNVITKLVKYVEQNDRIKLEIPR